MAWPNNPTQTMYQPAKGVPLYYPRGQDPRPAAPTARATGGAATPAANPYTQTAPTTYGGNGQNGGANGGATNPYTSLPAMPGAARPALPSREVYSPERVNQIANRSINQLTTGLNDRQRALREQFAGTGAEGDLARKNDDMLRDAQLQAAGFRTDAELTATAANAEQGNKVADLERMLRDQDLNYSTERGRQEQTGRATALDALMRQLGFDVEQRGQDINADLERNRLQTQRDLTGRQQFIDYTLGGRGQDVQSSGQQLGYLSGVRGQDLGALNALAELLRGDQSANVAQRGQDIDYLSALYGIQSTNNRNDIQNQLQAALAALR